MACGHVRRAFGSENDSIRQGMSRDAGRGVRDASMADALVERSAAPLLPSSKAQAGTSRALSAFGLWFIGAERSPSAERVQWSCAPLYKSGSAKAARDAAQRRATISQWLNGV